AAELVFHLYMNAFRNDQSAFFRESGGRHRGNHHTDHGWGAVDVTRLEIAGKPAALAIDDTLASVRLAQPVAPGATVEIDLDFTTRLPRVFARTGWADDFFAVAQWFPKIAVFDGAWRANQLHLNSEFFADFGCRRIGTRTSSCASCCGRGTTGRATLPPPGRRWPSWRGAMGLIPTRRSPSSTCPRTWRRARAAWNIRRCSPR